MEPIGYRVSSTGVGVPEGGAKELSCRHSHIHLGFSG